MMAHGKTESRLTCAGQAAHLGADYSKAIEYANGEYILFVDGDDILADNKALENISYKCNGNDMVSFNWSEFIDSMPNIKAPVGKELCYLNELYHDGREYLLDALEKNPLYVWYVVRYAIKLDFWKINQFYFKDNIKYEDVDLTYKIISKSKSIAVMNEIVYSYRKMRPGSTVTTVDTKTFSDGLFVIANNIKDINKSSDYSRELKKELCNNMSCIFYSFLIQSSRILDSSEKKSFWKKLEQYSWICDYTNVYPQKMVALGIKIFGIKKMANLLGIRRNLRILLKKQY